MKKFTLYLLVIIAFLSFTPTPSMAKNENSNTPTEKVESAEAQTMISRLEEIKAMDKSNMNSKEKKALRKEVRSIKKSLTEMNGGIYLSVGAIIIIILLLILLL